MNRFVPNMYKKDIFSINYKKLKEMNIKVLLFDFDNTIIEKDNYKIDKKIKALFEKLNKDFLIYIVSNSWNHKKIKTISEELETNYINDSRKPMKKGFKKLNFKSIKPNQIAMIGDQLITDVWGASRMGYLSILVDPISDHEWLGTKINRAFEKRIMVNNNLKRGKYYD